MPCVSLPGKSALKVPKSFWLFALLECKISKIMSLQEEEEEEGDDEDGDSGEPASSSSPRPGGRGGGGGGLSDESL